MLFPVYNVPTDSGTAWATPKNEEQVAATPPEGAEGTVIETVVAPVIEPKLVSFR
jgi:hypothetical protein